jgi:hypothetical protein
VADDEMKASYRYRARRRFEMGGRWLAEADFIVLDRLHGTYRARMISLHACTLTMSL